MRILSLVYEYPPVGGGGAAVAAALNHALVLNGDQVDVVTSAMRDLPRRETVDGVEVYRASCWRRHRHYTTFIELGTTLHTAYALAARLIREQRPHLIHTHFAFPSGIVAHRLWKQFGIPYVLTAHGSDIPGYNPDRFRILHRLMLPLWRRIVRDATAVTSPSNFLANLLRKSLDRDVCVIPNGYAPDVHHGQPKRTLVLVVARLFPRKGVQHFIESLRGQRLDWEIVVAGDGPYMGHLQKLAKDVGVPVKFLGFVDKFTLRRLYEEARILVFPSIRENFPMVLLEAMDAGCAIITTDAEGCAEVVGDAGVVVKKGDAVEIRRALLDLIGDDAKCRNLSAQGRARSLQFRWTRISAEYRHLFEHIVYPREATEVLGKVAARDGAAP
jgi:glycosyltransferase involved in cell wall biosynthesis